MNADTSRGANLRVNMRWLGLTLSARTLARELLRHADADGFVALRAEADLRRCRRASTPA